MVKAYEECSFHIFKEQHIDKACSNYGGGDIAVIMHAPDGSDVKNKADDTVTGNKGHRTTSEEATQ